MGAALALLVLVGALLLGTVPSLFGYEAYVVYSGSMEPAIGVGDLAVVGPVRPETLMVGDVITYRTAQRPDVVVTHRLVGIGLGEGGRLEFQTKGDANQSVDQVLVDGNALLGRVTYSIPKLGYLVDFSKRPEGRVLLVGIPGLLLALDYLLSARRRKRDSSAGGARAEATPITSEAGECLVRGRLALQNGSPHAALSHFDRAIAADPHLDEAWLLKAECLPDAHERLAVLRAGLTVNPGSVRLREAVEHAGTPRTAAG